jgi:hypothetical protein
MLAVAVAMTLEVGSEVHGSGERDADLAGPAEAEAAAESTLRPAPGATASDPGR